MSKYTDTTKINFGKYKGDSLEDVPAEYLLWAYDNVDGREKLKDYIRENMDELNQEVKDSKS